MPFLGKTPIILPQKHRSTGQNGKLRIDNIIIKCYIFYRLK